MRLITFVLLWLLALGAIAAPLPPADDAAIARNAREALHRAVAIDGPGAVVLIARGDRTIFREARGLAQIELDVPLAPDQVFPVASITKMFTAAMILRLAEEGRLSLDDPLSRTLPDFPEAGRITLRQLLNHTAGVSSMASDPQPGSAARDIDTALHLSEIAQRPLDFEPGSRPSYSNAGYIVLGAVIEKITGQPWHATIERQLMVPLGMHATRYGGNQALAPRRVAGYSTEGPADTVSNAGYIHLSVPAAAGGFLSSADDLRRWLQGLSTGAVLRPENWKRMGTPASGVQGTWPDGGYGFGTMVWHVRGAPMLGHTGQIHGFATAAFLLPEQDVVLVVLANSDRFDARTMVRRLAAIVLGQPYARPVAVPPTAADVAALTGSYRTEDGGLRTIFAVEGKLFTRRGELEAVPLHWTADGRLYFDTDQLAFLVPVRDGRGKVSALDFHRLGEGVTGSLPRVD